MLKKLNQEYIFVFFLILAFLPYFYLSQFTNPSVDDFAFSANARDNDWFQLLYDTYFNWNGRYASNVFVYLNPIVFGNFRLYKFIPVVMLLVFLAMNHWLLRELFSKMARIKRWALALGLSLLYIHNMPVISEGIFWYTGAMTYHMGLIFGIGYFALLVSALKRSNKTKQLFLWLLLFASCGFNEALTVLMVCVLGFILAIIIRAKLPFKRTVAIQFGLSITFALLMLLAPGNYFRGETYERANDFFHSIYYSFLQSGRFSFTWILSLPLVVSSILFIPLNKYLTQDYKIFNNRFYLNRWVSLCALPAIIFICVFPPYWGTGILGQHRTLNMGYYFFLIMWFVNLSIWLNHYQEQFRFAFRKWTMILLSGFFIGGILFTSNGIYCLNDLSSGSAKSFDENLSNRIVQLEKSKMEGTVIMEFDEIELKPRCLFVMDITDDPNYWPNQAYNLYFRMDSKKIILKQKK